MPRPGSPTASLWSDYEDPTKAPGESPLRPEAIARRAERPPSQSSRHSESSSAHQPERPPARQSNHRPLSPITEASFSTHTHSSRTERGSYEYEEDPYSAYQQHQEPYPQDPYNQFPQYTHPGGRYSPETHTEYPPSPPLPPRVIPCDNPHHPSGPHRHPYPEPSSRRHHSRSSDRTSDRDTERSHHHDHSSHGHHTEYQPFNYVEPSTRHTPPLRQARKVLVPMIINEDGSVRPARPGEGLGAPPPFRERRSPSPSAPPRRRSSSRRRRH